VKLAQVVREGAAVRLHRAAVIQRPTTWSSDDRLGTGEPITSLGEIRAALECGGFIGRNAVCALPMNVCQLRSLNIPPGSDQERRTIIADELADEWGEQRGSMEFDYWEMDAGREKSSDTFNVSVVAAARPWISQVWRDCQRAGVECWAIDGLPLTMARAVEMCGGVSDGRRALAVDWGYSNTTLCIVGEGHALYSRRIPACSFGRVLDALIARFGITLDDAQHLAETEGLPSPHPLPTGDLQLQHAFAQAAAPVLDELVRQISRTLQFAETQRRHLQPQSIWLQGGGASLKNAAAYLARELSLPVHTVSLAPSGAAIACAAGSRSAIFGSAAALSALALKEAA
jgi:type IV pilus assembly protein PilM